MRRRDLLAMGSGLAVSGVAGDAFAAAPTPRADTRQAVAARAFIRRHAHRLALEPTDQGADLAALGRVVGNARIAGFGEATHGSREVFRLKHRAFRWLADNGGFTAFAIEANYAEAARLDAWVKGGDGDVETLVSGLGFWTWDTEELIELMQWMRAANVGRDRKLSVYGIDIQFATGNLQRLFAYMDRAGVIAAPRNRFADFLAGAPTIAAGYRVLKTFPPDRQARLRSDAAELARSLDDHREALVAAQGLPAFLDARAAALASAWYFVMEARDADRQFTALRGEYDVRDRAMADLTLAALEMEGAEGRVFVWAHNAHIGLARHIDQRQTLGQFLRQDLGPGYIAVGFGFDQGGFQALPPSDPDRPGEAPQLTGFTLPPAPADHAEAMLRAGPSPAFLLDLRVLEPGSPAYGWFAHARPFRWTGSNYSEALMAKHPPLILSEHYDALIFVHETTRSRPTRATRRRFGLPDLAP